jgi:hypothetical protein
MLTGPSPMSSATEQPKETKEPIDFGTFNYSKFRYLPHFLIFCFFIIMVVLIIEVNKAASVCDNPNVELLNSYEALQKNFTELSKLFENAMCWTQIGPESWELQNCCPGNAYCISDGQPDTP